MRVAVVTTFLPGSRSSGADIASMNLVEALRLAGHAVRVHGYASPTGRPPEADEIAVAPCTGEWSRAGPATRLRWMASAFLHGRAVASQKFVTGAYRSRLHAIADGCDAWILDHHYLDWLRPPRRLPLVAVVHNIEHALVADRAGRAGGPERLLLRRDARLLRRAEEEVLRAADAAWCFSEQDAATAAGWCRAAGCVPLCGLDPGAGAGQDAAQVDAAILGLWTWEPNHRGLAWFLDRVLPLLPPDFTIAIGGRGADGMTSDPRVRIMGFVPEAIPFLRSARAQVIPSIAGGGVQLKTINALNLGITTIATRVAMRGIAAPPWAVQADEPAEMAAALVAARAGARHDPQAGRAWYRARLDQLAQTLDRDLRRIVAA